MFPLASDRQRRNSLVSLVAMVICLPLIAWSADASKAAESGPENLALGKAYRLHPSPNYRYCTDRGDKQQLTDGKKTEDYFWTQTGTVGWTGAAFASVTVDLGKVEPIGGASLRTAAGRAGVTWPMAVYVLVSDDGETYRLAGDLLAKHLEQHGALPEQYAILRLEGGFATRARYVQFVLVPFPGGNYLFVDEIEVFRGDEELLSTPPTGRVVRNAAALYRETRLQRAVQERMRRDVLAVRELIEASELGDARRRQLSRELDELSREAEEHRPVADDSFRAVLPIGRTHEELFAVQAKAWRSAGHPGFTATAARTWDPLALVGWPDHDTGALRVDAMRGEHRAAAINLANSTGKTSTVRVRFEGVPGGAAPDWVTVHQVEWTDTSQLEPVAAALPKAGRDEDGWSVAVPRGLVRQVWLTFHPQDVPPGEYAGAVIVEAPNRTPLSIPLTVKIWPMQLPQQTSLLLGGWSYTDGRGSRGVTSQNRAALLRHLQQRYVNAPWATSAVLRDFRFVDGGAEDVQLNTERFDRWIEQWPNAQAYFVFLSVGSYAGANRTSLDGAEVGSGEFDRRVGIWISAWVKHLRSKGIRPSQLGLLIHDEPHEGSDIGPLLAWARAIRKAEPEVMIWEDPTYRKPREAPAELFEACDVLCPNRPMWLSRKEAFRSFYGRQLAAGRALHLYSCSGPARLLDPYSYYRLQAWHAWQIGATGSFFWSFSDNSGVSSWNEYLAARGPYTPLFLDDNSVTAGKQMEAIRESVQDYETLVMLGKALAKAKRNGRNDAAVKRAEQLLESGPARVLADASDDRLRWHAAKDRTVADTVRVELLSVLAELTR